MRKISLLLSLIVLSACMAFATAPTPLTVPTLKQNNYAVQAGDLTITFAACDATNGNSFYMTGQEILLVENADSASHTFTVSSVADTLGRVDSSLTAYTVAVSPAVVGVQMKVLQGWVQTGQLVNLTCSSTMLKFAVIRYQ